MTETESKWTERIEEWRAGGQSAGEYAQGRGFEGSTLRWWASRLGRGIGGAKGVPPEERASRVRMARVVVTETTRAEPSSLTLVIGAVHVEVQRGFDVALLRDVMAALGGAS
jgi:hypothetical protein